MSIPRIELAPGYTISRIIRGGWQLAQGHSQTGVDANTAIAGMRASVEAGITTFDCADIYTGVEALVGKFLRTTHRETPIQIHTKYVPDLGALASLSESDTTATIDRSLQRLGVERLDLVQFHWWDYDIPGYVEAALTLNKLRQRGKIQHIGVTNFDVSHLAQILDAGVPIVSNQVQYSVLDRRPEVAMAPWCAEHDISLLCYGALAGGFLSDRYLGVSEPTEPFENRSLTKYRLIIEEFGGWARFQQLLDALKLIAERLNASLSAVATRLVLDRPQAAAAIVGMRRNAHLEDVKRLFALEPDPDDLDTLRACLDAASGPSGPVYGLERLKGGRHANVMKTNLNKT